MKHIKEIQNPFNNAPVYYIGKTSSTMDLAREQISENFAKYKDISGCVIAAGFQTKGRGRISGRVWESAAGKNLTFTLILHKTALPIDQKALSSSFNIPMPLAVGLGLSFYFEEYKKLKPKIKWPNDVLISGKKISGIYIQYVKDFYLIGVGINCNQLVFPSDISASATSLRKETGLNVDIYAELETVLLCIYRVIHRTTIKDEIEKRLYMKGREVTFLPGDPNKNNKIVGILSGIGEGGTLLLDSKGVITSISAGEMLL